MFSKFITTILFVISFIDIHCQSGVSKECFMIMVGKEASDNGSVLIAHNNDLTGMESSLIEIIDTTVTNDSIRFPSGLTLPAYKKSIPVLMIRIAEGFAEGDAVAINENMVSIGGGVGLESDMRNLTSTQDTSLLGGVTGGIRYQVLRNSKTAKECVQMLGSVFSNYGAAYHSGIAIADTSEIWYMETGEGKTWAAVRVPDWACMVVANSYRIGQISFDDKNNFLTSPGLLEFCKKNLLCDSSATSINFSKLFGGAKENKSYDNRRVWRGMSLLNDELNISPDDNSFSEFIKPKEKVSVRKLISILRDRYEGTQFSFENNPDERAIASVTTVHSTVVEMNVKYPKETGAILWSGFSNPANNIFLPIYYGVDEIPFEYGIETEDFDARSAFWIFKEFSDKLENIDNGLRKKINENLRTFENRVINSQPEIVKKYILFKSKDESTAKSFLTQYVKALVDNCLGLIKTISTQLDKLKN